MKWAMVDGRRSLATPGLVGACPGCGGEVVAKCGEVLQWHWAHRASECDPWSEPESEWHINWKNQFPAEWQERVIGDHRADVLTPRGVIEFQKSSISTREISEREQFYGKMLWVIDASDFSLEKTAGLYWKKLRQTNPFVYEEWDDSLGYFSANREYMEFHMPSIDAAWEAEPHYRWLWPRKSWLAAKKVLFLDRGYDYLLQVKWISRTGGLLICKRIQKKQFLELALTTPRSSAPQPQT